MSPIRTAAEGRDPARGRGGRDCHRDHGAPVTGPGSLLSAGSSAEDAPASLFAAPPKLRFGFGRRDELPPPPPRGRHVAAGAPVGGGVRGDRHARRGRDRATARKVVTIGFEDDLEQLETTPFDPSPVDLARPGVDPRLRARRIQVRRDEGRKRLRWAALGGAGVACSWGAGLVLESPLFAVNDVEVTGAVYTDPARLDRRHRPVYRLAKLTASILNRTKLQFNFPQEQAWI